MSKSKLEAYLEDQAAFARKLGKVAAVELGHPELAAAGERLATKLEEWEERSAHTKICGKSHRTIEALRKCRGNP